MFTMCTNLNHGHILYYYIKYPNIMQPLCMSNLGLYKLNIYTYFLNNVYT